MAVVGTAELMRPGSAQQSLNGFKWVTTYTDLYRVTVDTVATNQVAVLAAPGLPLPFATKSGHSGAFVNSRSCQRDETDGLHWNVTIGYTTDMECRTDDPDDPLDDPVQVDVNFAQFQKAFEKDLDDNEIKNKAGQPFDPPLEGDASNLVLRFSKNLATYPIGFAIDYQDAVNSNEFSGVDKGRAKVQSITASWAVLNCIEYWSVTTEIHFRRDGWQPEVLEQGVMARPAAGQPAERVIRKNTPVTEPVLLAADGTEASETTEPTFTKFKIYKERDFTALGFLGFDEALVKIGD